MGLNKFVCLEYDKAEYFILSKYVQGSFTIVDSNIQTIPLDSIVKFFFNENISKRQSFIIMVNDQKLKTSAVARVIDIDTKDLKIIPGVIGNYLRKEGISAFKLEKNIKPQYIIDLNALVATFQKIGCH